MYILQSVKTLFLGKSEDSTVSILRRIIKDKDKTQLHNETNRLEAKKSLKMLKRIAPAGIQAVVMNIGISWFHKPRYSVRDCDNFSDYKLISSCPSCCNEHEYYPDP